jgi:MoaD family protein
MIKVKIKSFLTMKEIIGNGEIRLSKENSTIKGLLNELSEIHGEPFRRRIFNPRTGLVQGYWIVVNDRHRPDLEHKLKDGDEVIFFQAWAGG